MDIDRQLIETLRAEGLLTVEPLAEAEVALTRSRRIGSGVGIIMVVCDVTEDGALALLQSASRNTGRTLRELADDIVTTGDLSAVLPPPTARD